VAPPRSTTCALPLSQMTWPPMAFCQSSVAGYG